MTTNTPSKIAEAGPGTALVNFALDMPWIGPVIQYPDNQLRFDIAHGAPRIAAMSRPDQGAGHLVLIPCQRVRRGAGWTYRLPVIPAGENLQTWVSVENPTNQPIPFIGEKRMGSRDQWHCLAARTATWAPKDDTTEHGDLVLILHDINQTTFTFNDQPSNKEIDHALKGIHLDRSQSIYEIESIDNAAETIWGTHRQLFAAETVNKRSPSSVIGEKTLYHDALFKAAALWIASRPLGHVVPFVAFADLDRARRSANRDAGSPPRRFRFLVGSCQYPGGPLDGDIAQRSLMRMASISTPSTDGNESASLALFLGDQIYADATAGLGDPTRRDERFEKPNIEALRRPGMRELMRRIPVKTLLDDHEIIDNWEPLPSYSWSPKIHRATKDRVVNQELQHWGLRAYFRYQRQMPFRRTYPKTADFEMTFNGVPFFFADTRTGRQLRSAGGQRDFILSPRQIRRLRQWLLQHKNALKFVCTPSLLLPRHRDTATAAGSRVRGDAWDAYEASLHALLRFMLKHHIQNTVFLSGDEHHSFYCPITLADHRSIDKSPRRPDVQLLCLHSSGLYAPFPFANGDPRDLVFNETITVGGIRIAVGAAVKPAPGNGFTELIVSPDAPNPLETLQAVFH